MRHRTRSIVCAAVGVLLLASTAGGRQTASDAWKFFGPEASLSPADHQRLADQDVVVRMLPAKDGQLAVFAVTRLNASAETFLAWIHAIADLKRSTFIPALGGFSDPPATTDLDGLVLDQRDLDAIRRCQPNACALKLSSSEIDRLRRVSEHESPPAVQAEFRHLLLDRLDRYRSTGLAGIPVAAGGGRGDPPAEVFASLLTNSSFLTGHMTVLDSWLTGVPHPNDRGVESFMYWSKEYYGSRRSVISMMHVGIVRGTPGGAIPEVVVVGKQIFATRYMNGALTVTAFVREAGSGRTYLAYLYRSHLDVLGGLFGGLGRAVVQSQLKERTPALLRDLRKRMESGPPGHAATARVDR